MKGGRRLEFRGMTSRIPRARRLEFDRNREGNSLIARSTSAGSGDEFRGSGNSVAASGEWTPRIDFGVCGG